ncbi:MAG: hypothetical protein ABI986_05110 [Chloroflexota bacterium]
MKIAGIQLEGDNRNLPPQKTKRAALGALYGFLSGAAFVFMAAFVDILLYRDLPLGVDWKLFATRLPLISLGLALIGAVTAWWSEAWQGLGAGALVAGALALIGSLAGSDASTNMKLIVLIFILVPVAISSLPVTWVMRWLVEQHGRALHTERPRLRVALLILLTILLGAGGGFFMHMSPRAVRATRFVNTLLQNIADETSPIHKVPGLAEHSGISYQLLQKESEFSTEGFDVFANYKDGYILSCVVIMYPGRDPNLSICKPVQK